MRFDACMRSCVSWHTQVGLAKTVTKTLAKVSVQGAVAYMAPEVATLRSCSLASDVYVACHATCLRDRGSTWAPIAVVLSSLSFRVVGWWLQCQKCLVCSTVIVGFGT